MIAAFGVTAEPEPGEISISAAAVMAVHITRLALDGSGKARTNRDKIMIGAPSGSPIALAAAAGDLAGMAITEGIEDALSVHEATGPGRLGCRLGVVPASAGNGGAKLGGVRDDHRR